ncbi:MarR family transcriptional regulator [Pediococcus pentosaceus]|jgi:DNA-binding MarR family transcriptional regulator|uniref:MarR family transcriptional regulator n=1 Tax=Pediococcus pentosaceus TaxID=1255 RepID=A0A6L5A644_PEDPE|nr:MarR family transcriptional regulator [Pediococcus pentosaceus]KAF0413883.1 MarR family transcriptional regulator [Pediococcus pentosaceus]KAF0423258.1 MarR family transcriptional regulator [Pediococcus pentosaceus]KAF0503292.1 MarR family transcriptional regulator [Pediococcus pentosaceus]MBF7108934.1 MarR family transcriptional regulator [Pediococcus pentosaceus]MBF7119809.1 MarR family transcriptional regulator [Pediococcus pentosaceus]
MSKQNIRTLEDHFCFSVYATSHAIQRLYKTELVNHGLTYPQYLVLVVLYEQEGMSVKQIGKQLNLGTGTTTPLLKRMEKMDLVIRQRNPDDERGTLVTLTSKGKQERLALEKLPNLLVDSTTLTDQEWNQLTALTNKLMNELIP